MRYNSDNSDEDTYGQSAWYEPLLKMTSDNFDDGF